MHSIFQKIPNLIFFSCFVVDQISLACKDCGLKFSDTEIFKTHLHQHALEDETEEDAQEVEPGDSGNCATELDSERDGSGENGGGGKDGGEVSSLKPVGSLEHTEAACLNEKHRNVYTCLVCGKVYTYLVSFRKHQEQHEKESSTAKTQKSGNLQKYDCPECGMSFIRQVRLRGHMKTHRSQMFDSNPPRCDQCNIEFTSTDQWLTHIELHEEKPFWCLRCAKGFADEKALDKHLHSHSQRQHTCNICHKRFHLVTELRDHYKAHTGTRAYQCTLCGKSFPFLGKLIAHRKKHFKVYGGANGMGIKNSRISKKRVKKKKRWLLSSIKEEPEVDMNVAEPPEIENEMTELPREDVEFADSEDSDCGEPMHRSKPSKQQGSGGPDWSKLETAPLKAGQNLNKEESEGGHVHGGHNYWEWECCECDVGFDEVAKLHLHYIKHATGELPIPRDDIEC